MRIDGLRHARARIRRRGKDNLAVYLSQYDIEDPFRRDRRVQNAVAMALLVIGLLAVAMSTPGHVSS